MQQSNFMAAEVVYRKAQMIDPDANKACNLALCLIEQSRFADAELVLGDVLAGRFPAGQDQQDDGKILRKVAELLGRIMAEETTSTGGGAAAAAAEGQQPQDDDEHDCEDWVEREILKLLDVAVTQYSWKSNRRLPVFEEISPIGMEQMAC
jgi:hypothetical protein